MRHGVLCVLRVKERSRLILERILKRKDRRDLRSVLIFVTSYDEAASAVCLVCIDPWSRNVVCIPTASKGKGLIDHLAEGVTYMSTQLQYGAINLKADNEGTIKKSSRSVRSSDHR